MLVKVLWWRQESVPDILFCGNHIQRNSVRMPAFILLVIFSLYFMPFSAVFGQATEVKVAIIDSGCNIQYEEGVSFVDDSPVDLNGHGTNVAKIIKEINPGVKLYVAKVFTQNSRNTEVLPLVKGIRWAIGHQVDLINLSLEIRKDDKDLRDAIQEAFRQGIMLIAAAGNTGEFLGVLTDELCKYSEKCMLDEGSARSDDVKYPARYAEVIAVGSMKGFWRFKKRADESPKGAEIEFVCKGSYGSQEGTSFAAARATGVISRIKSDYQNIKGEELRELLRRHVRDMGDKGRDIEFGYGRLVYLDVRC